MSDRDGFKSLKRREFLAGAGIGIALLFGFKKYVDFFEDKYNREEDHVIIEPIQPKRDVKNLYMITKKSGETVLPIRVRVSNGYLTRGLQHAEDQVGIYSLSVFDGNYEQLYHAIDVLGWNYGGGFITDIEVPFEHKEGEYRIVFNGYNIHPSKHPFNRLYGETLDIALGKTDNLVVLKGIKDKPQSIWFIHKEKEDFIEKVAD